MKKIFFLVIILTSFVSFANAQIKAAGKPTRDNEKINDGEMKTYLMVFLNEGPNREQIESEASQIQKDHLAYLTKMYQEGVLLMAGPFKDDQKIKGILVLNITQIEEAKAIVEQDPAIKAGRLIAEYHLWYTKSGTITLP